MSDSCFFSFIIPVYKVEKYLPQCVDSILCQSYEDFEVILVDDGSPDTCPAICDSYAAQDPRVRVIHKKNSGVSSARNVGMTSAEGEYIIFLDSDDYWSSPDCLSRVYNHIQKCSPDILVIKHSSFFEGTNTLDTSNNCFSPEDFTSDSYDRRLLQLVSQQLYDACPWNKIFRRCLLDTTDLFFLEGVIAEDVDWSARLCLAANSVSILSEPIHVYRKGRPGSLTSSIKLKNIIDTKDNILRCLEYPTVKQQSDLFQQAYYSYVAYRYVIWFAESTLVVSPETKDLFNEMAKLRWLFQYDANIKVRLARLAHRFLGLKLTTKLLGRYLAKKR